MTTLLALLGVLYLIAPIVSFVMALMQRGRVTTLERELSDARRRLEVLERQLQGEGPGRVVLPPAALIPPPPGLHRHSAPPAPVPLSKPLDVPPAVKPAPAPAGVQPPVTTPPPSPSPFWGWVTGFFTGSGAFARIGAVLLLIGLGSLLKYASDAGLISPPLRVLAAVLVAAALFAVGWRLRERQRPFALALQGAAFGILYLTVYAAWRLSDLLPGGASLALLAVLGVGLGALAVRQNAQALAWLGILGGFLAPLLTAGPESGFAAALWPYYLLLNLAVCALAWWRDWRALYALGFFSTFVVAVLWGVLRGRPDAAGAAEVTLVLLALLYFAVPLLEAWRGRPAGGFVQGLLIFGTPAVFLSLQGALLGFTRTPLAVSALAVAVLEGGAAVWLARVRPTARLERRGFAAVAATAFTLAVPLAFDWDVTVGVWGLQGAALAWYAGRGRSRGWAAAGLAVQALALGAWWLVLVFTVALDSGRLTPPVFVNALLLGAAGVLSAWALGGLGRGWSVPVGVYGVLAWLGSGCLYALDRFPVGGDALALAWVAVTALLGALLAPRLGGAGDVLRWAALAPAPAALLLTLARVGQPDPLARLGWLGFALALALGWWSAGQVARPAVTRAFRALGVWVGLLVLAWWLAARLNPLGEPWPTLAWALLPLAALVTATLLAARRPAWAPGWRLGWLPVLAALLLWAFTHLDLPPEAPGLPYLPLLNPADLTLAAVGLMGWAVLTRSGAHRTPGLPDLMAPVWARLPARLAPRLLGALGVAWFTTLLLRAVSHYTLVPWDWDDLLGDSAAQTTVTLGWAVLGIAGMTWATRRGVREVWLIGAGLLALVTLKLFLVDLSGVSALARIVSFLGAGALFLLVGYLSPAPPQERERAAG